MSESERPSTDSRRASVELFAERAASVADDLAAAMREPLPAIDRRARRWITTGIGGSEGPARMLASELARAGIPARFVAVSAFLDDPPKADALVVFSQQLSPNGSLPLRARDRYERVVVVTAAGDDARLQGLTVVRHGPVEEDGLLVRVRGPALAHLTALRIACAVGAPSWADRLVDVPAAIASASPRGIGDRLFGPTTLVTQGDTGETHAGHRLKLLEALGTTDIDVVDACGLVHGPLQSFFTEPRILLHLGRHDDALTTKLRDRLASVLARGRHELVALDARLPAPLAWFEHAATIDALVVEALRARPRDLARWPGQGHDAAIYGLGA